MKNIKLKHIIVMITIILLLMILILSQALGAEYNLEPGNCMIDGVSNNTYCSEWPNKNQIIDLEFEEDWYHEGMNLTVICQDFPLINEVTKLGFDEKKTWHDYNLSVECANLNYTTVSLLTGQNKTDEKHKIHIECGIGQTAVQDVKEGEKDLYPGDQWYGIRCVPPREPITGTILLEENTSFGEWNFTSPSGTAMITVNPSEYFTAEMGYAKRYAEINKDYDQCMSSLNELEQDKNNYKTMVIFIAILIAIIAIMMFKDNRVGHLLSWFKDPKINWNKFKKQKIKEDKAGHVEVEVPVKTQRDYEDDQRRMSEYRKKFGLK